MVNVKHCEYWIDALYLRPTYNDSGGFSLQDVVRSWYSRLPSMVQNAQQLVANSEECARACSDGETVHLNRVHTGELRAVISES